LWLYPHKTEKTRAIEKTQNTRKRRKLTGSNTDNNLRRNRLLKEKQSKRKAKGNPGIRSKQFMSGEADNFQGKLFVVERTPVGSEGSLMGERGECPGKYLSLTNPERSKGPKT